VKARSLVGIGLAAAAAALLASCNPLSSPLPNNAVDVPVVQHLASSGTFTYTVDPGSTPGDVYFVFTNPSMTANAAQKPSVQGASIVIDGKSLPAPSPQPLYSENNEPRSLAERIAEFNRDPSAFLSLPPSGRPSPNISTRPAQNDALGQLDTFVTDIDSYGNPTASVAATCRKVTGQVDLGDGRKRALSIWVDSANWDLSDSIPTEMSVTKILEFADRFLKAPASANDIYHWNTAVVGEPWGSHTDPQLIPWDPNATVTILLCNLNASYAGSVIVGYFWAKDNFSTTYLPGSNQRIMFYIDATLLGKLEGLESTWSVNNYWPKIIFSTLAHEFQHMIQFYQKQILRGAATGTDTWINETCSMIMEDLVADKLGVEGPRGIANADGSAGSAGIVEGRIPDFNGYSYYPLAVTSGYGLTDYSISYAFGSWLARNYGGTELLRRIVQCPETNTTAVTNAAAEGSGLPGENMTRLLEKWAASVLLSDMTTAPVRYRYNTGGWTTSTAGGLDYHLGSINIFNYAPALYVFTQAGTVPGTVFNRSSNIYYQAALGLGTARTWTITVPQGILMTVVIK
jgi:hypothetical protein